MMIKDFAISTQLVDLCDIALIEGIVIKWEVSELNELDNTIVSILNKENTDSDGIEKEVISARIIEHLQADKIALVQNNKVVEVYASEKAFEPKKEAFEKVNDIEEVKVILIQE